MSSTKTDKPVPTHIKFILGAVAGMGATSIIQPLDLVKTRMQVAAPGTYNSGVNALTTIVRTEGTFKLYNGLSAALLRQLTYGSSRLAIFNILIEKSSTNSKNEKITPTASQRALCGLAAGGLGSIIGNPAEVCLVRMTSDGRLPVNERRNYTSVNNALFRIIKEEGILTLWKGCTPTITRAMVLNMAQLGSYSQIKQMLLDSKKLNFKEGFQTHVLSAASAGVISSFASLPVDNIKTKVQNMKPDKEGKMPFSGPRDCLVKTIRNEGVGALWTGIGPYIVRISPHAIFCLVFLEQLTKAYKKFS